jgi:hypothetical protein
MVDIVLARVLGRRLHGSLQKMQQDFRARLVAHDEESRLAPLKWHADIARGCYRRLPYSRPASR